MKLDLKYRPKSLDDVVGQKATSVILKAMLTKGELEPVLMFTGPSGTGKTSMARIIAAELNPDSKEDVHSGTHPNVLEIDAASNGSVAALRQLKQDLNFSSVGHKVVILDEAHAISKEGKAVLLNLLEFPPDEVTFILLTTEPHEIPIEVRHRCDTYHFKKASIADLKQRLAFVVASEGVSVDDELLSIIAQRSEGSYRESLMLLGQVLAGGITTAAQYYELHGQADYGPILLKKSLQGPSAGVQALQEVLLRASAEDVAEQLIVTLADLMLLKDRLDIDITGTDLEIRQNIADQLTKANILKCLRIMWDLQTKLANSNLTSGLLMAISLIGEAIGKETPESVAVSKPAPMSFSQMQKYRS